MKQEDLRRRLIQSAISVVARDGIHKTTTKSISTEADVNVVYIYRMFEDKHDLLREAFYAMDHELVSCLEMHKSVMYREEMPIEDRCWEFFINCWRFLLGDREKCSFFIRYYHSSHFDTYPMERRKETYRAVLESFAPAFIEGADVWLIFNHMMDIVFSNILKVLRGHLPDTDEVARAVYDLLYQSLKPYLIWSGTKSPMPLAVSY